MKSNSVNVSDVLEKREVIKLLQQEVIEAENIVGEEMLATMTYSGEEYSMDELSMITKGVLTPRQALAVCRAIESMKEGYNTRGYRKKRTKFQCAKRFTSFNPTFNKRPKTVYSIACDADGNPFEGARVKEEIKWSRVCSLRP